VAGHALAPPTWSRPMRAALSDHDAHPNPHPATTTLSDRDAAIFAKEVGARATGLGWLEARARRAALEADGCTEDEVLEGMVDGAICRKEHSKRHLCSRCWHDCAQRCICHHLGHLQTTLPAKVLVLMHHKEYLKAGDDAKLLLAMLPAERTELYVFGRRGDLARLQAELRVDPAHTLILWPGNDALTVDEFVERLPRTSPWRSSRSGRSSTEAAVAVGHAAGAAGATGAAGAADAAAGAAGAAGAADAAAGAAGAAGAADAAGAARRSELPVLRVVVIDGAYGHARTMFRHLKRREVLAPHVALHPKTLSLYHRAQKSYAAKSAVGVLQDRDG
jgi:DTW domain-containing protein YfiP